MPTDPTRAEVKEAIDDFLQNEVVAKGSVESITDNVKCYTEALASGKVKPAIFVKSAEEMKEHFGDP